MALTCSGSCEPPKRCECAEIVLKLRVHLVRPECKRARLFWLLGSLSC